MKSTSRFISLLILSLIILVSPHISSSEEVNEKIALLGALHHAQEVFGPLVHFNTQLFVDLDDIPQAYVFILCHPQNPVLDLMISQEDILSGFLSDYEQFGIVTAIAGANRSHVPVIQMYRGLPDYIINFMRIKTTIKQKTSENGWIMVRHLYLSPLEFWLEFQIPMSLESLFVRVSDMNIIYGDRIEQLRYRTMRARNVNLDKDRAERIIKKWEFVESLCQNRIGERGDPAN